MVKNESVILVVYKDDYYIDEAKSLAEAAGYGVSEVITIRKFHGGKFGISEEKASMLKSLVLNKNATKVIVDEKLSASQNYNLSKHVGCPVLDREKLVLEIFALRAVTEEAKLQVKLAELAYELPKVREYVKIQKFGEQPGMFGYGSYDVEKYFRSIKQRMNSIRQKLSRSVARRELFRMHRIKSGFPVVSLAGYTSAGKTTLFNRLTSSLSVSSPNPFTTLTTTTRRMNVGTVDVLISDTVGFIDRLPHYMIEAFKSTLEELKFADLVILVIDLNDNLDNLQRKYITCRKTLSELDVKDENLIIAFNKADLLNKDIIYEKVRFLDDDLGQVFFISALRGDGIEELKNNIVKFFERKVKNVLAKDVTSESL